MPWILSFVSDSLEWSHTFTYTSHGDTHDYDISYIFQEPTLSISYPTTNHSITKTQVDPSSNQACCFDVLIKDSLKDHFCSRVWIDEKNEKLTEAILDEALILGCISENRKKPIKHKPWCWFYNHCLQEFKQYLCIYTHAEISTPSLFSFIFHNIYSIVRNRTNTLGCLALTSGLARPNTRTVSVDISA